MGVKKGVSTKARKEAFFEAMLKTFGNITQSAKLADIPRMTVHWWIRNDPEFEKKVHSDIYDEMFLDAIDAKLAKVAIQDENPTVLIFLAKTKGRKRGYIERQQVDLTNNGNSFNPVFTVLNQEAADEINDFLNERHPEGDTKSLSE